MINKKTLLAGLLLLSSIPAVIFATVDIGGSQLGGAGNYVITDSVSVDGWIFANWVSASNVQANTVEATEIESYYLNVGSSYTNQVLLSGSSAIGASNFVSASNTLAVGLGLEAMADSNTLIVGEYNEDKLGVIFSAGNGTAAKRANVFEVWDDGKVIISQPQGDVSMGDYGVPSP